MQDHLDNHMIRVGHGEPMLLIHGLGHVKEAWDPVLPALAAHYDVVAVDLPGFGGSPSLDVAPTGEALADWCEQLLDDLGWDTAHLVGNSLGGLVAIRLGGRGRARSVTAISPGGMQVGWEQTWSKVLLNTMKRLAPALARKMPAAYDSALGRQLSLSAVFGRPTQMNAAYARLSMEGLGRAPGFQATLDNVDWTVPDVTQIAAPVTIAWGTKDRLLLPRQGARWARSLDGSRLVKLEGLGHTPMPDDPALVADVVLRTAAVANAAA